MNRERLSLKKVLFTLLNLTMVSESVPAKGNSFDININEKSVIYELLNLTHIIKERRNIH